jgi:hypothetical protein
MRNFSKVNPQIWGRKPFKDLSDGGKLMIFYFLTCRHQNSAGCYQVPDGYVTSDLRWTQEQYDTFRTEVEQAGWIAYDVETQEVYVIDWFKENPITNDKHREGVKRLIGILDSEKLANLAYEAIGEL